MSLIRAASTVSFMTLLSRVSGLLRDQVMAGVFGAGAAADAFHVAFRIPNLFRRLFAEGAFSQAFVPLLARTREMDGDVATRNLVDAVATVLTWTLVVVSALGVVAAPVLVWMMGSGLQAFDMAVVLTRWMFPYIGCMSLVALCAGVLNTWRRFAVPAATPVLLNLAMIAATVWGAPAFKAWGLQPIYALAGGVMVGGVLQVTVQLLALRRLGMTPRLGLTPTALQAAWQHNGVRRVLQLMAPAVLGVSVSQVSLLINTQIASQLAVGAVSWIVYADRLMEFPTALLGVALGVVLSPRLAEAQARADRETYSALLDWGLRLVLLLALPCAMALLFFGKPMIAVLFHYGAFTAADVDRTAWALYGNGAGLVGIIAVKVLAPGYFAQQDVKTPMKIGLLVLAVTQGLNLLFVPWFSHAGLTLSIGVAALINAGLLLAGLLRRRVYVPAAGWTGFAVKVVMASALLAVAFHGASSLVDWTGLQARPAWRVGCLAAMLSGGAVLYGLLLTALRIDLRQFLRRS